MTSSWCILYCLAVQDQQRRGIQMGTLFWVLVGAFIGWNFPQPWWARFVQEKLLTSLKDKIKD